MPDISGAGSQAGQPAGSQAGQQAAGAQQGQSGAQGSQAGQGLTREQVLAELKFDGQHDGESLEQYISRLNGALTTARKQSASYRTRLNAAGIEVDAQGNPVDQAGSQAGQQGQNGQQGTQQGQPDTRVATLERQLRELREAGVRATTDGQLRDALEREGAINASQALKLIDREGLNIGPDGSVDDPVGAVRALKASMPYVFTDTRGSGDGGAGNAGAGNPDDFNAQLRRRAGVGG